MRTVLVVAAEAFELRWIRPGRDDLRFVKVANGPGPRLAAVACDGVGGNVDAVLSTGLCGALSPGLDVGAVFVATSVNGEAVSTPATRARFSSGPLLSVDRVAVSAGEKRRLASTTGAKVVEMEAAAVLEKARILGVPFYCVRAVSDTAEETFALDLNAARDADGRFSVLRIAALAARNPVVGVPELLRLRRNAGRAAKALGEFIADCDF